MYKYGYKYVSRMWNWNNRCALEIEDRIYYSFGTFIFIQELK